MIHIDDIDKSLTRKHRETGKPHGRPKAAGSRRDTAERTGVDPKTQERLRRESPESV